MFFSNEYNLFQFQRELRKILITLIDAAHKVLCMNPDIDKLFQTAEGETVAFFVSNPET